MKKNKRTPRGLFFVLDGPDGSGKTTQTELLAKRLRAKKRKVLIVDFPQYNSSFFGAMVGAYLKGEFGDVFQISPYLSSLLYALDRFSARDKIEKALKEGYVVLANRFTSSNLIHQGAKFKTKCEREDFFAWLDIVEFSALKIPRPTRVIFLDVPPTVSWKLIEHRNRASHPQGSKRDKHEESRAHLRKAYAVAKKYAQQRNDWFIVSCAEGKTLLTPGQVHEKVVKKIQRLLSV